MKLWSNIKRLQLFAMILLVVSQIAYGSSTNYTPKIVLIENLTDFDIWYLPEGKNVFAKIDFTNNKWFPETGINFGKEKSIKFQLRNQRSTGTTYGFEENIEIQKIGTQYQIQHLKSGILQSEPKQNFPSNRIGIRFKYVPQPISPQKSTTLRPVLPIASRNKIEEQQVPVLVRSTRSTAQQMDIMAAAEQAEQERLRQAEAARIAEETRLATKRTQQEQATRRAAEQKQEAERLAAEQAEQERIRYQAEQARLRQKQEQESLRQAETARMAQEQAARRAAEEERIRQEQERKAAEQARLRQAEAARIAEETRLATERTQQEQAREAHEVALVSQKNTITLVAGRSPATVLLEQELAAYFASTLTAFTVPLKMHGTIFQQNVWQQLLRIPHGQTQSYAQLAQAVGNPKGYRAAANANGANKIVIIIPCHRVIQSNGGIGGYNCGVEKKKQLLMHERNNL